MKDPGSFAKSTVNPLELVIPVTDLEMLYPLSAAPTGLPELLMFLNLTISPTSKL